FSDYRDRNGNLIVIYDPLTTRPNPNGSGVIRDPFPGNVIPANRLDPVGRNVASIYPLPNGPGNFDNYTSTVNRSVRDHSFTGRPAFLPVHPKQRHYQVEDTLSWVKGKHTFKTGYRFLLRKPTPFTHTNTRSSISVNRNLTNNPQTNSQGSGISTLLLGYTTG